MSLRTILSTAMTLLGGLTLACALSLITMGRYLDRATNELEKGIESIRLLQEIELNLLAYDRTDSAEARASLATAIRAGLEGAQAFIDVPEEQTSLDRARGAVGAYLARALNGVGAPATREGDDLTLTPAVEALRDLADVNVRQARETTRLADAWKARGDAVAAIAAAGLALGVAGVVTWLRVSAFRPVFAIEQAVLRFGRGDPAARAPERGASELRAIARSFNELSSDLTRRQKERLTFLAGVAHDLKNPLSALKLSSALLRPDRPLPPEDRLRKEIARVQRQVDRLDRMVGDLLDETRIEAGVLELRLSECDARTVALGVFELFREVSPAHEISLASPDDPLQLVCDPLRLEQVFINLVSNAIKYSPNGGVIHVALAREGEQAVFTVEDHGIGMSPEDLRRIFEPFHRSDNLRDSIPGVGIGLSVAKRITEAHGGRIEVQSAPDRGSTFRVWLPLHDAATPAAS